MTAQIALYIYLAGILPACALDGWHNARHGIYDAPPAVCTGLAWPLLAVILGIVAPAVLAVIWLFEAPARLGAWLVTRAGHKGART